MATSEEQELLLRGPGRQREGEKKSGFRVAAVNGTGNYKPAASPFFCSTEENSPEAVLASQQGPKAPQLSSTYTAVSHLSLNKNTGLCSN